VKAAAAWLEARISELGLPFQRPRLDPLVLLAPARQAAEDASGDDSGAGARGNLE
jgi:hypothetical protein